MSISHPGNSPGNTLRRSRGTTRGDAHPKPLPNKEVTVLVTLSNGGLVDMAVCVSP
jgi:hypothetical protein